MFLRKLALACLVSVSIVSHVQSQEQLRWKFTPGQQRSMAMTHASDSSGVAGAESKTKTVMRMSWNVDKVAPDGTAHISQKIHRVKATMNFPGLEPLEHDTDNPAADPSPLLATSIPIYNALLDSAFKFTMTPQGKVVDFTGAEAIEKAASGGVGTIHGAERIAESSVVMFPPMVQVGGTWKDERSSKSAIGMITTTATYTFHGDVTVDERVLKRIGMVMDISLEPTAETLAKIELTSSQGSGEMLFDNTTGLPCFANQHIHDGHEGERRDRSNDGTERVDQDCRGLP